ncbi:hypothetical protein BGL34_02145 [Fructilactobacillus lindneri]|uniref:Uncharacterized protein n=2 Tax=Fructilactobacillus lindneri TaxID=53444 RepID=A0A0R2JMB8_9LACO|nr:UPF0223 family protein [Fructilactobacillus lindneri]ANZ58032.1 hypothetical protein AYR60_04440 [Fructilactobacillus lindneri]ANZ59302.1 hypothetical protein AYR59_04440 [Fructilactobacillus lindneri]KRN78339.1 hypothetical protein IV52_GL001277 [Fructilactobacillus lindneri DSM 20690 = JCM 11027]POG98861.1 hypothetical protein BGL31_02735 [Fructilactobacillus lindneri]POH00118.1 hypothetical protein BGL33_06030 [Fructilactobacillus lindneri]
MVRKTNETYSYPIVEDWSTEELTDVTEFFRNIERAYDLPNGVNRQKLLNSFRRFQEINPSRTEQNNLRREFERNSGFDIYHTLKKAKENPKIKNIKQND